jgi:hypothetical protein
LIAVVATYASFPSSVVFAAGFVARFVAVVFFAVDAFAVVRFAAGFFEAVVVFAVGFLAVVFFAGGFVAADGSLVAAFFAGARRSAAGFRAGLVAGTGRPSHTGGCPRVYATGCCA